MAIVVVLIVLVSGFFLFARDASGPTQNETNYPVEEETMSEDTSQNVVPQKKSPHFVDSSPAHGELFAAAPKNIVINFNFDLSPKSTIQVAHENLKIEPTTGATTVDNTKLTLRQDLLGELPDGRYTVSYNACWPDNSCHDGQFDFIIDSKLKSEYQNMTGKTQVQISLKSIAFSPAKIVVSKGTKVTWTNDEAVGHYVNTDPHPSHTFYLGQNSKELKQGDAYSVTFSEAGEYPYHCSAHAATMIGRVVVE